MSNNHIFDFIRLQSAGLEGQYHQIQYFQSKTFFYNQDLQYLSLYWLSTMSNILYVNQSCDASYFDKIIDEANQKEGTDISKRDFTGPDFTAWAKALFNPYKPYEERGIHPSGVGINRYIKPSDLNSEEIAYLKKQAKLQWLNLLSPHLLGFTKINIKSSEKGKYYANFAIRHLLTSFGNDITIDLFYQTPKDKIFICLHNYNNFKSAFFGIEGEIIDKQILKDKLLLNSKCMLWTQPKDQSFTTKKANLGGMINIRCTYPIGVWFPYIEIEGKTKGWIMGNVFLEENLSIRCGINIRVK